MLFIGLLFVLAVGQELTNFTYVEHGKDWDASFCRKGKTISQLRWTSVTSDAQKVRQKNRLVSIYGLQASKCNDKVLQHDVPYQ